MRTETSQEYFEFCESLVIEEIIKEFNFNCELKYVGKKWYGGSHITQYIFEDELGLTWKYDVNPKMFNELQNRSPKIRTRIC